MNSSEFDTTLTTPRVFVPDVSLIDKKAVGIRKMLIDKLYAIRIFWKFFDTFKLKSKNLFTPIEEMQKLDNPVIVELGCWPWYSFEMLLKHIWKRFWKIIFIEANHCSIEIFREKLQKSRFCKYLNRIEFINADLWTEEWLKKVADNLWDINIDLVYAKAFIHHLDDEEQNRLFIFFKDKLWKNGILFFYNQFILDNTETSIQNNITIAIYLRIIWDILTNDIWFKKDDIVDLASKEVDVRKFICKLKVRHILWSFMKYKWKSILNLQYSEELYLSILDDLKKWWIKSFDEMIDWLLQVYVYFFSSSINNDINLKYNLQKIWDLQKNMENALGKEIEVIKSDTSWVASLTWRNNYK